MSYPHLISNARRPFASTQAHHALAVLIAGVLGARRPLRHPCRDSRPARRPTFRTAASLRRIAHHRHADQVAISHQAVGRIELRPAAARKENAHPGMGVPAALRRAGSPARRACRGSRRRTAPRGRACAHASIISTAKSRQVPRPSASVSSRRAAAARWPALIGQLVMDRQRHGRQDVRRVDLGSPSRKRRDQAASTRSGSG